MKSKLKIKSILFMTLVGLTSLFIINYSFAAETAKVNVETANVREAADSSSNLVGQLSISDEVEIVEKSNDWYKIKAKGIEGYVREDLLKINQKEENKVEEKQQESKQEQKTEETKQEEKNETNQDIKVGEYRLSKNIKLKIVPSINATDIAELKEGESIKSVEVINGWICVETQDKKGWIRKENIKADEVKEQEKQEEQEEEKEEPEDKEEEQQQSEQSEEKALKTMFISKETVNLRAKASTSSDVVTSLSLNVAVEVYAEENGWSKVKVGGKEGYILSSLLSEQKQQTSRNMEKPRENTNTQTESSNETQTNAPASSGNGGSVVDKAMTYIGSKYVYGGSGPSSFDCSGFTSYIYNQYGVSLSRTAAGQYGNGTSVSRSELQPGDLIMFGPSASSINHVGIYIGGGQIVHAANPSRGVTTDTINSGYYNTNYVGARRVM